eukprot:808274-Ditylum_brightwellii.AAC.1
MMLVKDIVLAIGAYKSAFCTNAKHRGIYRDDGLVVFTGKCTRMQVARWLSRYQTLVNKIVEGDYLQFIMEIWSSMEPSINKISNNNINDRQTHSPMEKWMQR